MSLRRGQARLAVSEKMVQMEARRRWGIPATSKWVAGWMERQRLSIRLRTTHKEINAEQMVELKQQYQNKMVNLFNIVSHNHILNTDETSVYFDSSDNRTIDEIGVRSVQIGHTEHYADRVSIVLCVSASGRLLPPLVVHTCDEKVRFKKTGKYTLEVYNTPKHEPEVPAVAMWVTHKRTAWLDTEMMCVWMKEVYAQGVQSFGIETSETVLFMDGCSAHHTEESEEMGRQLGIQVECLPPNCTASLPCDQHVNALFKKYYHDEWFEWYNP